MPPGIWKDETSGCSGLHGPSGDGAVRATTSLLPPLVYSTRYCLRWSLYWPDISPTGPGKIGVAAPGSIGTQPLPSPFQYWYLVRSGNAPGWTRDRKAAPLRPGGVPNEYR